MKNLWESYKKNLEKDIRESWKSHEKFIQMSGESHGKVKKKSWESPENVLRKSTNLIQLRTSVLSSVKGQSLTSWMGSQATMANGMVTMLSSSS